MPFPGRPCPGPAHRDASAQSSDRAGRSSSRARGHDGSRSRAPSSRPRGARAHRLHRDRAGASAASVRRPSWGAAAIAAGRAEPAGPRGPATAAIPRAAVHGVTARAGRQLRAPRRASQPQAVRTRHPMAYVTVPAPAQDADLQEQAGHFAIQPMSYTNKLGGMTDSRHNQPSRSRGLAP